MENLIQIWTEQSSQLSSIPMVAVFVVIICTFMFLLKLSIKIIFRVSIIIVLLAYTPLTIDSITSFFSK